MFRGYKIIDLLLKSQFMKIKVFVLLYFHKDLGSEITEELHI